MMKIILSFIILFFQSSISELSYSEDVEESFPYHQIDIDDAVEIRVRNHLIVFNLQKVSDFNEKETLFEETLHSDLELYMMNYDVQFGVIFCEELEKKEYFRYCHNHQRTLNFHAKCGKENYCKEPYFQGSYGELTLVSQIELLIGVTILQFDGQVTLLEDTNHLLQQLASDRDMAIGGEMNKRIVIFTHDYLPWKVADIVGTVRLKHTFPLTLILSEKQFSFNSTACMSLYQFFSFDTQLLKEDLALNAKKMPSHLRCPNVYLIENFDNHSTITPIESVVDIPQIDLLANYYKNGLSTHEDDIIDYDEFIYEPITSSEYETMSKNLKDSNEGQMDHYITVELNKIDKKEQKLLKFIYNELFSAVTDCRSYSNLLVWVKILPIIKPGTSDITINMDILPFSRKIHQFSGNINELLDESSEVTDKFCEIINRTINITNYWKILNVILSDSTYPNLFLNHTSDDSLRNVLEVERKFNEEDSRLQYIYESTIYDINQYPLSNLGKTNDVLEVVNISPNLLQLNESHFYQFLSSTDDVVIVLFFMRFEHISRAYVSWLSKLIENSKEGNLRKQIAVVNCFDWNDLCGKNQMDIIVYPQMVLFYEGEYQETLTKQYFGSSGFNNDLIKTFLETSNDIIHNKFKLVKQNEIPKRLPDDRQLWFLCDNCELIEDHLNKLDFKDIVHGNYSRLKILNMNNFRKRYQLSIVECFDKDFCLIRFNNDHEQLENILNYISLRTDELIKIKSFNEFLTMSMQSMKMSENSYRFAYNMEDVFSKNIFLTNVPSSHQIVILFNGNTELLNELVTDNFTNQLTYEVMNKFNELQHVYHILYGNGRNGNDLVARQFQHYVNVLTFWNNLSDSDRDDTDTLKMIKNKVGKFITSEKVGVYGLDRKEEMVYTLIDNMKSIDELFHAIVSWEKNELPLLGNFPTNITVTLPPIDNEINVCGNEDKKEEANNGVLPLHSIIKPLPLSTKKFKKSQYDSLMDDTIRKNEVKNIMEKYRDSTEL
ncbi:hypothetical protein SNEBB_000884 [Seison nebaliae]|nr:hypothetical protein SNEBB_000884 [Seison nebaliae]